MNFYAMHFNVTRIEVGQKYKPFGTYPSSFLSKFLTILTCHDDMSQNDHDLALLPSMVENSDCSCRVTVSELTFLPQKR